MENKFLSKLEKVLLPIGDKIGNQKHLAAISTGMMMTLSLIVVGSLFLILANPPINVDLVNPETQSIFEIYVKLEKICYRKLCNIN